MPDSTGDILERPEFWVGYLLSTMSEQEGVAEDEACDAFGVDEDDVLAFWNEFTAWHDGVLDEDDGWLPEPTTLRLAASGGVFQIECHPGGTRYRIDLGDGDVVRFGEIGPHSTYPLLRWEEVNALAGRVAALDTERTGDRAFILTLPLASLQEIDAGVARTVIVDAGEKVFGAERPATWLAGAWLAFATDDELGKWMLDPLDADGGWVHTGDQSVRAMTSNRLASINRALEQLLAVG